MGDLVAFLAARLDEDEAVARGAVRWSEGASDWAAEGEPDWTHIARHDPARVLREVEAKRRIVADLLAEKHDVVEDCWYTCGAATEELEGETCCDDRYAGVCTCGLDRRRERVFRLLALSYADHQDYRPEWAPAYQAR